MPFLAERLHCDPIHIGLAAQAYNAYKAGWGDPAATAQRTLAIVLNGQ